MKLRQRAEQSLQTAEEELNKLKAQQAAPTKDTVSVGLKQEIERLASKKGHSRGGTFYVRVCLQSIDEFVCGCKKVMCIVVFRRLCHVWPLNDNLLG